MAREDPQMKIRFPVDLKDRIEESAKNNARTMNAEIVSRLEASFSASQSQVTQDGLFQYMIQSRIETITNRTETNKIREQLLRSRMETLRFRQRDLDRKKEMLINNPAALANAELDEMLLEIASVDDEMHQVHAELKNIERLTAANLAELETAKTLIASYRSKLEDQFKRSE